MEEASASDLSLAGSQGTILLIEYGGVWYGSSVVGDVSEPTEEEVEEEAEEAGAKASVSASQLSAFSSQLSALRQHQCLWRLWRRGQRRHGPL